MIVTTGSKQLAVSLLREYGQLKPMKGTLNSQAVKNEQFCFTFHDYLFESTIALFCNTQNYETDRQCYE